MKTFKNGAGLSYFVNQEKKMQNADTKSKTQEVDDKGRPKNKDAPIEIYAGELDANEYLESPELPSYIEVLDQMQNKDESTESEDEDFNWYVPRDHEEDTYFCLINTQRRILQSGEQCFYQYGERSNKFLLTHYGFCLKDNKADSYSIKLKLEIDLSDPFVP